MQHHNDTIIKTDSGRFLYKYMYLSFYCKGSKRVTQGLRVRESWRPNRNCNILTPTLMAVNVVSFSFSQGTTGGPGPICWMMAFFTAFYQQLLWSPNSIGVPEGPFGRVWFYLATLVSVSNSTATGTWTRTQLYCNCHLTSVLTELYNSSTPTRSPTRSLKSHV